MPRWIGNIVLSLVSIGLTLALLEAGMRLFYWAPDSHRMPDPVLGWRLVPGAEVTIRKPEFRTRVRINSHGWRDVEHDYAKPDGTFRIVILGDSYIEGYTVDFEETLARQLQARVADYEAVEVINLGVGGYGTYQEYLAYIGYGTKYDPDLVLLGFYPGNDPADNVYSLMAALQGDDPNVYSRPYLMLDGSVQPPDYERALAERASREWWEKTSIYDVVTRLGTLQQQETDLLLANGAFLCDPSADYAAAWDVTAEILHRLDAAVHEGGARLIVFNVPARIEVSESLQAQLRAKSGNPDAFCFNPSAASMQLAAILDEHEIPHMNLLPAFLEAHAAGQELFYRQDRHWNEAGHALAARVIEEMLQAGGWLP